MSLRRNAYLAAILGLSLCACTETRDPMTGQVLISGPSFAQLVGMQPTPPAGYVPTAYQPGATRPPEAPREAPAVSGPVQNFALREGDTRGTATLQPLADGSYSVELSVGRPGGAGDAVGRAMRTGKNTLLMIRDKDGNSCYLQMTLTRTQLRVKEATPPGFVPGGDIPAGCIMDHGASVEFDGVYHRTR